MRKGLTKISDRRKKRAAEIGVKHMKKIILLFLSLLIASCTSTPVMEYSKDGRFGSKCRDFCSVTIAQLVITPARFQGKIVQVYGLLSIKFEDTGVSSGEHRVWLDLSREEFKKYKNFDGKEGVVRGTYDGTNTGHFGMWGGAIHSITRLGK